MDIKMFDNVKYEKEKAMVRFNKFQKMKRILKVLQTVFVFLLLVWSTKNIPLAVILSGKLFEVSVCYLNPHFAFLIGNLIILALFLLCKQPAAGNSSNQEYSSHREASQPASEVTLTAPRMPLTSPEVTLTSPEVTLTSPHAELTSPEVSFTSPEVSLTSPVEMLTSPVVVTGVVEDNVKSEEELEKVVENVQCEAAEVVIAAAEQDIRRFERTFSEKLKKEISVRLRKELRRSETENGRLNGGRGGGGRKRMVTSSLKTVEHLSNEEFKLAIDAFIDKHRVFSKNNINAEMR